MVDLVHLKHELLHHVMSDDFKVVLAQQMPHIILAACEEVVHANDLHSQISFLGMRPTYSVTMLRYPIAIVSCCTI